MTTPALYHEFMLYPSTGHKFCRFHKRGLTPLFFTSQTPSTDPTVPNNPIFEPSASIPQPPKRQQKRKMSQLRFNTNSFNNVYHNVNSFNTPFNNVYYVNTFGTAHERAEILAWLSPLEPRIRHHEIRTRRVKRVGEWFLQTEEYRNWLDGAHGGESDNSAFLCYGNLGVGKTYIR